MQIKVQEIIQRYEAGERDFAGLVIEKEYLGLLKVYLRRANLSRTSLAYANLEEADLRQTVLYASGSAARHGVCVNVTHANLSGATVSPGFPIELVAVRPDGTETGAE